MGVPVVNDTPGQACSNLALGVLNPYNSGPNQTEKRTHPSHVDQSHPAARNGIKPKYEVKVDLDDRAFLFPAGKLVAQLLFLSDGKRIFVEAVYPFNQSRTLPRLLTLDFEDAKDLGRRLIEAVHHARTQLVATDGVRITINVIPNGYHIQIGDMNHATELFLSTACIWRVCQGLRRIIDLIAPVESN
jgi:hypothetical protein